MTPYNSTPYADRTEVGHDNDNDRQVIPESLDLNLNQEVTHDLSDDDSDFEPQPESDDLGESDDESDEESESDVDSDQVFHATVISSTTSQDDVRRLARLRVYNMAYLHPSRAFGPFLPLETHHTSLSSPTTHISSSGAVKEDEQRALADQNSTRLGSPSTAVLPAPPIPDTNTNSLLSTVAGAITSDLDLDDIDLSQFLDDNNDDETVGVAQSSGLSFFQLFPCVAHP